MTNGGKAQQETLLQLQKPAVCFVYFTAHSSISLVTRTGCISPVRSCHINFLHNTPTQVSSNMVEP